MLDIKIINGQIIDGTGNPAYHGDVGIRDGRIVALGSVDEAAIETIDAAGRVVAPGFIDVHTHYDAQVCWDATFSPSCYHGVTTVFGGFCGFSVAPLNPETAEYLVPMLARVEGMPIKALQEGVAWDWTSFGSYLSRFEGKVAINAGFSAGHSTIRRVVMGARAVGETASDEEILAMQQLLAESIEQGALGLSSTVSKTHNDGDGNPVPSRFASREELLRLASVCSRYEGTTLELLPGAEFDQDVYDLLTDFSLAGKRPVNWNLLAVTGSGPDEVKRPAIQLGAGTYARSKGGEVIALALPCTPTVRLNFYGGFLLDALPGWADMFQLPVAERIEKLKDTAFRKQLDDGAQSEAAGVFKMFSKWHEMTIVETFAAENKEYTGKTVGEIAERLHKTPFDALLDIVLVDGLRTSFMPRTGGEDQATYALRAQYWRDDRTVVGGSDAGAHNDMIDSFSFSTKLLQKGVREYGVISPEEAVHQLTEVPARLMGLRQRGVIREGWYADLVIFDLQQVACGTVYTRFDFPAEQPRLYAEAEGISHVVVNGQTIIRGGAYTGATPGTVLHSGRDTYTVNIAATSVNA